MTGCHCVFCTQFYDHHVLESSKKYVRPKATEPVPPSFPSWREDMRKAAEAERLAEEEDRKRREEEGNHEIFEEEQKKMRENARRLNDRLPLEVDRGVTTAQGKTYEDDAERYAVEHPGKSPTKDRFVNFMREESGRKGGSEEGQRGC